MPRICKVCSHSGRESIDKALVSGQSIPQIAALYRVSPDSLQRHKQGHVTRAIVRAAERREEKIGDNVLDHAQHIRTESIRLAQQAETEGDLRAALMAHKLALDSNDSLAKLLEKLGEGDQFQLRIVDIAAPESCPHCGFNFTDPSRA